MDCDRISIAARHRCRRWHGRRACNPRPKRASLLFSKVTTQDCRPKFGGRVSDSGEGRWTIKAAIDEGVPVPVLTTALYERFSSRGEADYADRLLSAMRFGFGGHLEKSAKFRSSGF
jgi:hypothetical protein